MEFVTRDWESGSGLRWYCIARDDEKLSTDSHLYKRAVSCKYYIAEWTDGLETYYSVTWPWRSCQDSGFGRDEIRTPTSRIRNGSAPLTTGRPLGVRVTADSALFVQFHEGRRHFAVHTVPFLELQLARDQTTCNPLRAGDTENVFLSNATDFGNDTAFWKFLHSCRLTLYRSR